MDAVHTHTSNTETLKAPLRLMMLCYETLRKNKCDIGEGEIDFTEQAQTSVSSVILWQVIVLTHPIMRPKSRQKETKQFLKLVMARQFQ